MLPEKRIDDLIEAGWHVLYSDFDALAFQDWRIKAFECLHSLLGPDHRYTQSFRQHVQEAAETSLLVGGGILSAAKESVVSREDLLAAEVAEPGGLNGVTETGVFYRE